MDDIYQFKISLADASPPIWRRVLVPSNYTLNQLHQIIQLSFAWENYHLFMFIVSGERYDSEDSRSLQKTLKQLDLHEKETFRYVYDFGDDWLHNITLETCLPKTSDQRYPCCMAGKRAGPPEDCGGIWSYEHRLAVLADKKHPEYRDTYEWMGGSIDPEAFNMDDINKRLGDW